MDACPDGVDLMPSVKTRCPSGAVHTAIVTILTGSVPFAGPQRAKKSGLGRAIQFLRMSVKTPLIVNDNNNPNTESWI